MAQIPLSSYYLSECRLIAVESERKHRWHVRGPDPSRVTAEGTLFRRRLSSRPWMRCELGTDTGEEALQASLCRRITRAATGGARFWMTRLARAVRRLGKGTVSRIILDSKAAPNG